MVASLLGCCYIVARDCYLVNMLLLGGCRGVLSDFYGVARELLDNNNVVDLWFLACSGFYGDVRWLQACSGCFP